MATATVPAQTCAARRHTQSQSQRHSHLQTPGHQFRTNTEPHALCITRSYNSLAWDSICHRFLSVPSFLEGWDCSSMSNCPTEHGSPTSGRFVNGPRLNSENRCRPCDPQSNRMRTLPRSQQRSWPDPATSI